MNFLLAREMPKKKKNHIKIGNCTYQNSQNLIIVIHKKNSIIHNCKSFLHFWGIPNLY